MVCLIIEGQSNDLLNKFEDNKKSMIGTNGGGELARGSTPDGASQ